MTFLSANMIKNFPGSDDSRGTTTRIYYSVPGPVTSNRSPEMRPDEFPGTIGDALKQDNLTRQTLTICRIVQVDGRTNLNEVFTEARFDEIQEATSYLNDAINARIQDITTALGGDVYSFIITKLDVVKNYTNTSGLHNQSGNHTVFVTWNYDVIIYGQFSPNPIVQPNPTPQVCSLYTGSTTLETAFFPPLGNCQANDTDPTLPPGQFKIEVGARIVAATEAEFHLNTPLTANNLYNLYYSIPAYSFSGPNGAGTGTIRFTMQVNGIVVRTFSLTKQVQNGYQQFTVPTGSANAVVRFEAITQLASPTTAVKDFGGYMFFGIANQYCGIN